MDVSWSDWQVVAAALRCGSFTAAAEDLGVGQATVSRRVAVVEEQLGHLLFDRHRSGLVPTEAVERLAPHLEALSTAAHGASLAVDGLETSARGEVRLAGPPGLCVDLAPRLAACLQQRHPDIQLTVLADIAARDLDRREADIALRLVPTTRGDLLVRRVASLRGGLFASPAYLATLPPHPSPDDVALVQYADEQADTPMARATASIGGRVVFKSNDYLVLRGAVSAGIGAGLFGELEAQWHGWQPVPIPLPGPLEASLYVVVHRALRRVPRVVAVLRAIDELMEETTSATPSPEG